MPLTLTIADDVRALLADGALAHLEARRAGLGPRARCAWCWQPLDSAPDGPGDEGPGDDGAGDDGAGDGVSVVVFDPHAGHDHGRREATIGCCHTRCRPSGVVALDGDRLERSLRPTAAHLGRRDATPAAVLVLETVADLAVLHPDGSVSELPLSGMAASGFAAGSSALDGRVGAVAGWWAELSGTELVVQGLVGRGQRQTYLATTLPSPAPDALASWSATALDDGALVLVGTAWPLADDGAPRDDAAPDPWSGFVDLGSLADDPVAVRAASVPVRPGPGEGVRRNDRCPCGSGAKYKACCGR